MRKLTFTFLLLLAVFTSCQKEPNISTEMHETFFLRNGDADMPVFVRGNGQSNVFILLLHGGPGDGALKYRNHTYSNLLEKEYAVVYWDQRHQGSSHGHLNDEDITIDNMVEDTYKLIKTLKARYGEDISLFLMGHSWGGMLGTSYMVKENYQHELKGWIDVDGAHDFPLMDIEITKLIKAVGTTEIAAGKNVEKWTTMIDYVATIDTTNISIEETTQLNQYAAEIEALLDQLNPKSQTELSPLGHYFLTPNNPITGTVNKSNLPDAFIEEIINTSLTDQLHKIEIPCLVQWGRYDFKVPVTIGEQVYEKISSTDKYLKIYEASGHSPMRFEPTAFVNDIVDFVEQHK